MSSRHPVEASAANFWDREVVDRLHQSWMEPAEIRSYINTAIGGHPGGWPLNWFVEQYPYREFSRGLVIGCGSGGFERDLIRRRICKNVDAFDISQESLAIARKLAEAEGMSTQISYYDADFNEPKLPGNTYDFIAFQFSLHHVAKLEKLLSAVSRSLRRDGLLFFEEYIGPSASEWNAQRLTLHNVIYQLLPRAWRLFDSLPLPINAEDPSEAVRSSEIIGQVKVGFDIVHKRDYGGNLLSVLYPMLDWTTTPNDALGLFVSAERQLLRSGDASFHAVVVARPKRGVRGVAAYLRYFCEPKLKRLAAL